MPNGPAAIPLVEAEASMFVKISSLSDLLLERGLFLGVLDIKRLIICKKKLVISMGVSGYIVCGLLIRFKVIPLYLIMR